MRTVQLSIRKADGWDTVVFEEIKSLHLAGAPRDGGGVQMTLIGKRDGSPNRVEQGVLEIADRHEALIDSPVPDADELSSLEDENSDICD